VFGPYRIRFGSPLRRSPDGATWHGARDVSQWAEPDVRPLGCAASAFIAGKARRLSSPLAGDVPPRHLISHVHSTGRRCAASAFNETYPFRGQAATSPFRRRRPVHSVGGVPAHSTGRQYAHAVACTALIITHALPRKRPQHINSAWTTDIMAPGDCSGVLALVTSIMYSLCFAPGPTCWGSASLYVPPLSYKREGTRRYKTDPTQTLKLSSSLKLNATHRQWSRVLRSGGLNHSKSSCSLVFIDHLTDRQNS
jgi:hypothetical protein